MKNPDEKQSLKRSLDALIQYNGKNTQEVKFFEIGIVVENIKEITKDDYHKIHSTFLKYSAGVVIEIKNNILFIDTFIPHVGPFNRLFYIIDLLDKQSIIYWIDSHGLYHYYGIKPLPSNIKETLSDLLKNSPQYKNDSDKKILKNLLKYS